MTKRKIKNYAPQGYNKSLGNSLVNKINLRKQINVNIQPEENEKKVIQSITHESDLNELIKNIELADEKWHKDSLKWVNSEKTDNDDEKLNEIIEKNKHLICIPRRPSPSTYSTAEELIKIENKNFVDWKRSLAKFAEENEVTLTPYEKNIELWRQLWRVIERSDILVQIVDARNPLLFRSEDLEKYVKEVDSRKKPLVLVNKCDLLSSNQLREWHNYFVQEKISAVFWSAKNAIENSEKTVENNTINNQKDETDDFKYIESSLELVNYFKKAAKEARSDLSSFVIGMVGYPNVGKSQTINALFGEKKTSVSATPGKTKHFQTLVIDKELTLCDCPGLVIPSFVYSTSEMVLNAILPISNIRDYFSPVQNLCNRIPRKNFEKLYSILLPITPNDKTDDLPTAHELLTTIAFMKGYMASSGVPDCSRAARLVLKDVISGRIKYLTSPPGISQTEYDKWNIPIESSSSYENFGKNILQQLNKRNLLLNNEKNKKKLDETFFGNNVAGVNYKRINGLDSNILVENKKHGNKNKKEKLRRIFSYLDA